MLTRLLIEEDVHQSGMRRKRIAFSRDRFLCLTVGSLVFIFIIYVYSVNYDDKWRPAVPSPRTHSGHMSPYDVAVPQIPLEWYQKMCYPEMKDFKRSIEDTYQKLDAMRKSPNKGCQEIWSIFNSMFLFHVIDAPIKVPSKFLPEVQQWLGNDPSLMYQFNHQKVYKIVNRDSFEESVFNPLRSRRPSSKDTINPQDYIKNLSLMTQKTCDFCNYKEHTAADVFGRIDNELSASSSNAFKLAKFHGLFFPKSHHPTNISYEALSDLFLNTSVQWFTKAHEIDGNQIYPSILWDLLPHAGASQVHPHIHGVLDEHQYAGSLEKSHEIAQQYYKRHGRSYWTDFVAVHWALGLAISKGTALAVVPVNARKDHEYLLISSKLSSDMMNLMYRVIEGYKNNLGVFCFSAAGALPPFIDEFYASPSYESPGLPAMFRIASRGVCTSVSSDVSSLELFTVNNINTDLDKTMSSITLPDEV